ncbi:MAG: hypothetical protein AAF916_09770 [Planctomycetota bacterium]
MKPHRRLLRDREALNAAIVAAGGRMLGHGRVRCPWCRENTPGASKEPARTYADRKGCWRFICPACQLNASVIGIAARATDRDTADVVAEIDARSAKPKRRGKRKAVRV